MSKQPHTPKVRKKGSEPFDPRPPIAPLTVRAPLPEVEQRQLIERIIAALRHRGMCGKANDDIRDLLERLDGRCYPKRV